MTDGHDEKNLDKKILSMLKDYYAPEIQNEDQSEEFEVFFRNIENKLDNDTTQKKINTLASNLEHQFLARQQRLFQAKNRFESGFFEKKENKFKNRKLVRNSFMIGSILVCIGLAGIANLKNNDAYKVIDFENKEKIWSELNLDAEQRKKIEEIDHQWQVYKNFEEEKIQIAKTRLLQEINKSEPDFALIDKYQREIFDFELHLKQQNFNTDLEKRFVLDKSQSLKFIRESHD